MLVWSAWSSAATCAGEGASPVRRRFGSSDGGAGAAEDAAAVGAFPVNSSVDWKSRFPDALVDCDAPVWSDFGLAAPAPADDINSELLLAGSRRRRRRGCVDPTSTRAARRARSEARAEDRTEDGHGRGRRTCREGKRSTRARRHEGPPPRRTCEYVVLECRGRNQPRDAGSCESASEAYIRQNQWLSYSKMKLTCV